MCKKVSHKSFYEYEPKILDVRGQFSRKIKTFKKRSMIQKFDYTESHISMWKQTEINLGFGRIFR